MAFDIHSDTAPVYVRIDGAIGYLILNRPEKRNAMSQAMIIK